MSSSNEKLVPVVCSIRMEKKADWKTVFEVNEKAFERKDESKLVERLRTMAYPQLSLVAEYEGRIVGHIFFSPVIIGGKREEPPAMGLGPMAVLPEMQNRTVGSQLVKAGLTDLRTRGYQVIVVMGHPEYYPKFGFMRASRYGLRYDQMIRDELFMALELRPGSLAGRSATVKYMAEFDAVG